MKEVHMTVTLTKLDFCKIISALESAASWQNDVWRHSVDGSFEYISAQDQSHQWTELARRIKNDMTHWKEET